MVDTEVLIVGAGPVGLTLAVDLGLRGVRCTLVEQKEAPQFLPKMERCNARTMEIFRRMGLADRIRAAGLPAHCPMDVFIVTSILEPPLLHLPYPSVAEARKTIAASTDASLPLEPYQLISQYTLEPLLKSFAETLPSVTVRYGTEFLDFVENPGSVTARLRSGSRTAELTALFLAGCDGGSSPIRKQLGIALRGEANILELRQALYRCDGLYERIPIGKGRHYHVADAQHTFLILQDSTRHFTLHAVVEQDSDMVAQFAKTIAMPLPFEMINCGVWRQNLLIADRYGSGSRVFLAGDAVHLVIPTGGLGMNTGCGDAIDLSWKLAATIAGWGGPNLLRSYEIERRQVGERNVAAARFAAAGRRKWRSMWRPNICDDTPEGAEARANLARIANVEQRKSNEMVGAELGYRYIGSPLIAAEAGEGPDHNFIDYVPSTYPGVRLPHVWLEDGTAVQDRIGYGHGYALLRFAGSGDVRALGRAFAAYGAPYAVLDLPDQRARDVYGCDLILVRPDLHVVWRGNALPEDPARLAALATGH
ncbi:MAG TPA: FAD-dependent monooxygenase [Xanthobacteraceae bacterium]|jgi:2-polyprenyl-6-methoxyphenol hydroxylase-like FAD-dependent oxidoreductase|nr:FAD-dependent monooxygenase [Xanthobacteraceae bacterium]